MKRVFLSLGSNIEPRERYLREALALLANYEEIKIQKKSSIYETDPVGFLDQDNFLNMVIEIYTSFTMLELLDACQAIEKKLGRKRTVRNGPRTIDLDILLYNQENRQLDRLRIPHPRIHERAFVLIPFAEIAPDVKLPTSGSTITELLEDLSVKDMKSVKKWNEV